MIMAALGITETELAGSESELLALVNLLSGDGQAVQPDHPRLSHITPAALRIDRFTTAHLADDDRAERISAWQELLRLVRSAADAGLTRISVPPAMVAAGRPDRVDYADALNRIQEGLQWLAPELECRGVVLCLRASAHGFLTSPPELRELLRTVNSHAIRADLEVCGRCDPADWRDWLRTLGRHVHVIGLPILPADLTEYAPEDSQAFRAALDEVRTAIAELIPPCPEPLSLVLRPAPC